MQALAPFLGAAKPRVFSRTGEAHPQTALRELRLVSLDWLVLPCPLLNRFESLERAGITQRFQSRMLPCSRQDLRQNTRATIQIRSLILFNKEKQMNILGTENRSELLKRLRKMAMLHDSLWEVARSISDELLDCELEAVLEQVQDLACLMAGRGARRQRRIPIHLHIQRRCVSEISSGYLGFYRAKFSQPAARFWGMLRELHCHQYLS